MPVVRIHRYRVAPDNLDALLAQRATVIDGIRRGHPGLTETRLVRQEDGSYLDTWRWESAEQMLAALTAAQGFPLVGATMALTEDDTAETGEIIDER
ncbi:antibiotic biosynthesis monooxygenase [Streptomyces sp. NPDC015232]|uniref:antibiotic biosynthesis monooxygenase n=1 Tax=unclassified Streptomyces TaxID=2593676 RepID=UPI0036FCF8ED